MATVQLKVGLPSGLLRSFARHSPSINKAVVQFRHSSQQPTTTNTGGNWFITSRLPIKDPVPGYLDTIGQGPLMDFVRFIVILSSVTGLLLAPIAYSHDEVMDSEKLHPTSQPESFLQQINDIMHIWRPKVQDKFKDEKKTIWYKSVHFWYAVSVMGCMAWGRAASQRYLKESSRHIRALAILPAVEGMLEPRVAIYPNYGPPRILPIRHAEISRHRFSPNDRGIDIAHRPTFGGLALWKMDEWTLEMNPTTGATFEGRHISPEQVYNMMKTTWMQHSGPVSEPGRNGFLRQLRSET
ncbi:hypothetical protein BDZ97DRAFT_1808312, partial [Flammula alnicola]